MSMEAFLLINENFLLECARERGERHAPVSCGLIVASREMEKKGVGQERACILVFNNNDIILILNIHTLTIQLER